MRLLFLCIRRRVNNSEYDYFYEYSAFEDDHHALNDEDKRIV